MTIHDEHVEGPAKCSMVDLHDAPDRVPVQVHITSAYRAYELADHHRVQACVKRPVQDGLLLFLPESAAGRSQES